MKFRHRIAIGTVLASLLVLSGCPVGMDRYHGREDSRGAAQQRHDDGRGRGNDDRRDDGHDHDDRHGGDEDHPR